MKKITTISLIVFGAIFLAGCGIQQSRQTQPITQTPVTQKLAEQAKLLETFKNSAYGYEITLPASWKAYSESDGKEIAPSPSQFPQNPLILTGTPPTLNFQIEVVTDNNVASFAKKFLSEGAVQDGSKYMIDGVVIYLAQNGSDVIKIYSSDSKFDQNDTIFNSLKFTK